MVVAEGEATSCACCASLRFPGAFVTLTTSPLSQSSLSPPNNLPFSPHPPPTPKLFLYPPLSTPRPPFSPPSPTPKLLLYPPLSTPRPPFSPHPQPPNSSYTLPCLPHDFPFHPPPQPPNSSYTLPCLTHHLP
ncbi:hypothetical protein Pcinc_006157 [Petrolisthes cinctipes]|uniref:Uncharacterized protein n=1 Tax=Petrolisthes cinctipes TaxID=88211 RepID=A0AAE1GHW7_PETCI|nr:hypothetical protein Pcinc_006157 [Petrolisthes cinctipes]